MTEKHGCPMTQKFHSILWWVMLSLFAVLSFEHVLPYRLDGDLPLLGIMFIVLATILRAIVLAIDFHKAGEKMNFRLSLLLILLIGLAALAGTLV